MKNGFMTKRNKIEVEYYNNKESGASFLCSVMQTPRVRVYCAGRDSLGCAQGVLSDGTPFVAELWRYGDSKLVTVVIPYKEFTDEDRAMFKDNLGDDFDFTNKYSTDEYAGEFRHAIHYPVDELDGKRIGEYVCYLLMHKMFCFNNYRMAAVYYGLDSDENRVVAISIEIEYNG